MLLNKTQFDTLSIWLTHEGISPSELSRMNNADVRKLIRRMLAWFKGYRQESDRLKRQVIRGLYVMRDQWEGNDNER